MEMLGLSKAVVKGGDGTPKRRGRAPGDAHSSIAGWDSGRLEWKGSGGLT
jgi:hypothetical protein